VVNALIAEVGAKSLLDVGVGDGRVARGFRVERLVGLDVSPTAVAAAAHLLGDRPGWNMGVLGECVPPACDVAVSLDVVFHCIKNPAYVAHLDLLFGSARLAVGIYSTDHDAPTHLHVRHRLVSRDVARLFPGWSLTLKTLPPWPQEKFARRWSNSSWMVWVPR
jgi:trans-aconitate methyltransferase